MADVVLPQDEPFDLTPAEECFLHGYLFSHGYSNCIESFEDNDGGISYFTLKLMQYERMCGDEFKVEGRCSDAMTLELH